jgi:NADH:ubiquinone oxidoreductase subunit 5 (subunit L)/multisubunit Na+/H+ antiporter MnhA subunit
MLARSFWVTGQWSAEAWRRRFPGIASLLEHKYYFDELYAAVFVGGMDRTAIDAERFVDEPLFNGPVVGVARAAEDGAGSLSLTENGFIRSYILFFLAGVVVVAALVIYRLVA